MTAGIPKVGVVVVAYGDESLLPETVRCVLASTGVRVDLVVVDNGFTCPNRRDLDNDPRIRWVRPGRNTGFAGGCNLGAAAAAGEFLAFVNSDALVSSGALLSLFTQLQEPDVGLATGCVVLHDDPETINSVGNPVHYSLLSWAGGWGDSVADHRAIAAPASISGALFGVSRAHWDRLGGFNETLFAYGEDVELSLRTAMAGLTVRYAPDAVAQHDYEFHRNPMKYYLLERNRLINLLTLFQRRTLLWLAPGLIAVELGVNLAAVRQGWWLQKIAGYKWLLRHASDIRSRRRLVQRCRTVPDVELLSRLHLAVEPSELSGAQVPRAVNWFIAGLGRGGTRIVEATTARQPASRWRSPPRQAPR